MGATPAMLPDLRSPFAPKFVVTGPVRRRMVEIIANHPNGIARGELMDLLYADDADGGPDCAGTVSVLVLMANRQLRPQGWHIVSQRGPGARYRLEPIPTNSDAQNNGAQATKEGR